MLAPTHPSEPAKSNAVTDVTHPREKTDEEEADAGPTHNQEAKPRPQVRAYSDAEIDAAVRGAWEHFERLNDTHDPDAWA